MRRQRWTTGLVSLTAIALLAGCSSGPSGSGGAGGGGTTVSITRMGSIPWLAVQDGSGAWTAASGSSLVVTDPDGRFGVAWECVLASGQVEVAVTQQTTADGTTVVASCLFDQSPAYPVTGTLSGVPANGTAFVSIGNSFKTVTSANPSYDLPQVTAGTQTVVAYGLTSGSLPGNMLVERGLPVAGGGTHNLDLTSGESFYMTSFGVTGVPVGETPSMAAALVPQGSNFAFLAYQDNVTLLSYPLVPSALAQSGDLYYLDAGAGTSSGGSSSHQEVGLASKSPTSGNVQLPAPLEAGAGTSVSGGTGVATWGSVPFLTGGGEGVLIAAIAPDALTSPSWVAIVTPAWLASGSTSYTLPDLSSVAGWDSAWAFPIGLTGYATIAAVHTTTALTPYQLVRLARGEPDSIAALTNGATDQISLRVEQGVF